MDPNLSNLLKWSLANSTPSTPDSQSQQQPPSTSTTTTTTTTTTTRTPHLPSDALASLLSPQTDADLIRSSLTTITAPTSSPDDKLTAFTTLEQLLESIDNANTLATLNLWAPLVAQLTSSEPEVRRRAAGCVGTAVQNNGGAQGRLVTENAIPTLVRMALEDGDEGVRRKAIYALSSGMRNSQAATDEVVRALPGGVVSGAGAGGEGNGRVEAGDMEAIDGIMERLRERSSGMRGSG